MNHRSWFPITVITACAVALLTAALGGCGGAKPITPLARPTVPGAVLGPPHSEAALPGSEPAPVQELSDAELLETHRPNELGRVLILEYHHLGDEEERWTRRWDNFRRDLEMLYARGYRAVNLLDYVTGHMSLPAGTSPVIFTFDDGPLSQFKAARDAQGRLVPDPQSAVGILLAFAREYPDFGVAGTFYVNFTPVPFQERESWQEKIRFLVAHGFEVANHAIYHENLGELSDADVQRALAQQVQRLRQVLPEYDGSTLALPFGIYPENEALAVQGEWEGVAYQHRAVLLVGADPVFSPYDRRRDLHALPRVQAIESEFERWMPYLDEHRYISDGDPAAVTIPADLAGYLNPAATRGMRIRTYER